MNCPIIFNNSLCIISKGEVCRENNNFPRQMKVSPDGLYTLMTTENNEVQVHALPASLIDKCRYYQAANGINDTSNCGSYDNGGWKYHSINAIGESIYDIDWYPQMNSTTEGTSCYAVTSKDHPIHLYDAGTNELRASYNSINRLDELDSALSVCFNNDGSKLYAGADKVVRCFDVSHPGRQVSEIYTTKNRKDKSGVKGLISCLAFNPDMSGVYAAGSYANSVGLFVENQHRSVLELQHLSCGVTSIKWSKCGNNLWIGGRKNQDILCWDIRHTRMEVGRVHREVATNQKLSFDIDPWNRYIASGDTNGRLLVYCTSTFELVAESASVGPTLSNVSFHPWAALLVSCSGERQVTQPGGGLNSETDSDSDTDSDCDSDVRPIGKSECQLWRFDYTPTQYPTAVTAEATTVAAVTATTIDVTPAADVDMDVMTDGTTV